MSSSTIEPQKPEVYISQLQFNNNQTIEIKKNDIVVFVGPNNAGKSQSLEDIWRVSGDVWSGTVVRKIKFHSLNSRFWGEYVSRQYEEHFGYKLHSECFFPGTCVDDSHLDTVRDVCMCFLRTNERLAICEPPQRIETHAIMNHPLHLMASNHHYVETASKYFKKAFKTSLIPHPLQATTIPLCLGDNPTFPATLKNNVQEVIEWYSNYLDHLPLLHTQGDGMRSFAGLLLYLTLSQFQIYLIDEPEAFLHPPQATIMGHVVAELLKDNQQAFISTHSHHFIKGLLQKAPDRVKIIRITRDGDINSFSILDNDRICELFQDPLLKYSEALDGLFYKNVVICEGDTDCQFYSIVNDLLKEQQGKFSETLFVHSNGKDRMKSIARTLKALNIECHVIPDMDILSQKEVFQTLIEACGGSWEVFKTDYTILVNGLKHIDNLTGAQLQDKIQKILSSYLDKEVPRTIIEDLKNELDFKGKWDMIKKMGIRGVPNGDPSAALNRIIHNLKETGICIVPVGELEGFIKDAGGHGPKWLNNVLEQHPDLKDEVFNEAKHFVASWNI